ncbi:MAG: Major Facilitator Superfamily transporter [Xanthobacteraceae bacterium]|nr:Major Facilitator Superfamily transporter [Xanthobacteraceae bacterium]
MTNCTDCVRQPSRALLSNTATKIIAVFAAMTISACGAAPTPLFAHYQETFGLTPFMLTVIFAAYVVCLLLALLTTGSLSDYIGRRPVILGALLLNIVAMAMFVAAGSPAALIAARAVQGFATGVATTALGATILDTDRTNGPVLNSVTAFMGLTAGSLSAAVLVTYAPAPEQLIYFVLAAITAVEAAALWFMPETAAPKPGAMASLIPHVSVPPQAWRIYVQLTPVSIAIWALGGFYFSLMPSVVRAATGLHLPIVGGLVVAALTCSAFISVLFVRHVSANKVLSYGIVALASGVAITLVGEHTHTIALLLLGTVVAGAGFGSTFSATLRLMLPQAKADERAGLLSAIYVEGYLAFALPAILTGLLVPIVGLSVATDTYGAVVIILSVASLIATLVSRADA